MPKLLAPSYYDSSPSPHSSSALAKKNKKKKKQKKSKLSREELIYMNDEELLAATEQQRLGIFSNFKLVSHLDNVILFVRRAGLTEEFLVCLILQSIPEGPFIYYWIFILYCSVKFESILFYSVPSNGIIQSTINAKTLALEISYSSAFQIALALLLTSSEQKKRRNQRERSTNPTSLQTTCHPVPPSETT